MKTSNKQQKSDLLLFHLRLFYIFNVHVLFQSKFYKTNTIKTRFSILILQYGGQGNAAIKRLAKIVKVFNCICIEIYWVAYFLVVPTRLFLEHCYITLPDMIGFFHISKFL